MDESQKQQYFNDCALALNQEVAEAVDSTPWKPWRNREDQLRDIPNLEREIIDCFFFLCNMARCHDISGADLEARFHVVLANNQKRIKNGYNDKTR
jgi:NTP pyrophosphatase (non-canonical NTP hydrolase)